MIEEVKLAEWDRVVKTVPFVQRMLHQREPLENIIVEFAQEREWLIKKWMELEAIAPRRMNVNGVEYIYRCPDELVPVAFSDRFGTNYHCACNEVAKEAYNKSKADLSCALPKGNFKG